MLDTGGRLFKLAVQASYAETMQDPKLMLISTAFHTVSLLLRLLFWILAWLILRKFLSKLPYNHLFYAGGYGNCIPYMRRGYIFQFWMYVSCVLYL